MADLELIRESADGFTHQGHSVSYTDAYIKVRRSFLEKALRTLKGAPLSIFFAVSLSKDPPDVPTICELTGYHAETVCAGLDFLVRRHFLEELGRNGAHGVKVYRPLCYAYSGADRDAPDDLQIEDDARIRKNRIRGSNKTGRVEFGKSEFDNAENPNSTRGKSEFDAPPDAENPRGAPKQTRKPKNYHAENPRARHDMNDDVQNDSKDELIIHGAATRKILSAAGIEGPNLDALAERVPVSIAIQWAGWLERVDRTRWQNPEGFCVKKLLQNPTVLPYANQNKNQPPPRGFSITGPLAQMRFDVIPSAEESPESL